MQLEYKLMILFKFNVYLCCELGMDIIVKFFFLYTIILSRTSL